MALGRHSATILGAGILAVLAYREQKQEEWSVYMVILAWFFMGPLIFAITRWRGVFFS